MRRSYVQWSPLSLSNLYAGSTKFYVGQSGGYRLPFTSYSFSGSAVLLRVGSANEPGKVEFRFSPYRYAIAKEEEAEKYRVKISKEIVERAMANPETLADERLGVYVEERKVFNSNLANLPPALLAVNLLRGDGCGAHAVSMIFSNDGLLEKIKIEQKYRGTITLFQARDLKDELKDKRIKREEEQTKREQEEKNNRFKF